MNKEDGYYKAAVFSFALKFSFSSKPWPPAFCHTAIAFVRYIMQSWVQQTSSFIIFRSYPIPHVHKDMSWKQYFFLRSFPETKLIRACMLCLCGALIAVWPHANMSNWRILCFLEGGAKIVLLSEQEDGGGKTTARKIKSKYLACMEKITIYL